MHKIRFLPTKGKVCGAIFDRKYKQFDFVLFPMEVKIHVKVIFLLKVWCILQTPHFTFLVTIGSIEFM
jgi:hypothetical protein